MNNKVSDMCDQLGRKRIADSIGVRVTAVSNASVDGAFPASWFNVIDALCDEAGIKLSRSLFNFKGPPMDVSQSNQPHTPPASK